MWSLRWVYNRLGLVVDFKEAFCLCFYVNVLVYCNFSEERINPLCVSDTLLLHLSNKFTTLFSDLGF